jgi:hypothetical protein
MSERIPCPKIQPVVHEYGMLMTIRKYAGYNDNEGHHHVLTEVEVFQSTAAAKAMELVGASDPDVLEIRSSSNETNLN